MINSLIFTVQISALQASDVGMTSAIQTNTDTISNLRSAIRDSQISFAVERHSKCNADTIVTYDSKLSDTRNAMNPVSGVFTAPLNGSYVFLFHSTLECTNPSRFLTAMRNGVKEDVFRCESDPQTAIGRSSTLFFSFNLVVGDQVAVNSGNFNLFDFAKFTGFLLPNSMGLN